jgi:cholesterol transport system auxiliary component
MTSLRIWWGCLRRCGLQTICSFPPRGRRWGWGGRWRRNATHATPHLNPPPQGGRRLRNCRLIAAALSLTLVCGCEALRPLVTPSPQPNYYSLADARNDATPPAGPRAADTAPTLIVSPPHAAAGFDSQRIMYVRTTDQLEHFAHNEWIDTPARMLAPLIVGAVERSGAFRAVVQTPSPATGEMRLDTEILRLQHEFVSVPSQVRFTLRAYLVESVTRRVIASREFDAVVPASSEDPHGGVVAANRAVHTVLENLSAFCAEAARGARLAK